MTPNRSVPGWVQLSPRIQTEGAAEDDSLQSLHAKVVFWGCGDVPGAETDDHGIDTTLYKLQVDTFMASSADGFLMGVKMHALGCSQHRVKTGTD